jgi:rod shape-determining protein MreD
VSATAKVRLRMAVLVIVATVLQSALASDVRVLGVAPDLLLLLGICAGLADGAELGCLVGFAAGLCADVFLTTTPFGLSALTYCLTGYAVGMVRSNVLRDSWLLAPIVAFVATVVGVGLFVGIGDVVGQTGPSAAGGAWVVRVALVEGVWAAALSIGVHPLVVRLARRGAGAEVPEGRPDSTPAR